MGLPLETTEYFLTICTILKDKVSRTSQVSLLEIEWVGINHGISFGNRFFKVASDFVHFYLARLFLLSYLSHHRGQKTPSQMSLVLQRSTWIAVLIWSKIIFSYAQISFPDSFCMKPIYSLHKLNILHNKAIIVFNYRSSDENCLILKHWFVSDFAIGFFFCFNVLYLK